MLSYSKKTSQKVNSTLSFHLQFPWVPMQSFCHERNQLNWQCFQVHIYTLHTYSATAAVSFIHRHCLGQNGDKNTHCAHYGVMKLLHKAHGSNYRAYRKITPDIPKRIDCIFFVLASIPLAKCYSRRQ